MTATTPFLQQAEKLGRLASRYVQVESLPWKPTPCPGIDMKVLLEDPESGLLTALFRWQPGAELALHEHVEIEQTFVLEGSLVDDEGEVRAGIRLAPQRQSPHRPLTKGRAGAVDVPEAEYFSRRRCNRLGFEVSMTLKIYGVARSRAFRTLWMAKELELDYEHVKVDFASGETRTPAHLALNPNGHVPVIEDDGFVLWESMAINLYLAKKYGAGKLYPTRLEDEARAWQWSFWGMTEVERPVLTALFNRAILPEDKRDAAAGDAAEEQLAQPLQVLDGAFGRSANLLGADFTVADLNVASILAWARPAQIDMSPFPKTGEWLKNCAERPAARAARQLQRE